MSPQTSHGKEGFGSCVLLCEKRECQLGECGCASVCQAARKGNPESRSSLKAVETDAEEGRDMIAADLQVLVVSAQGSKYTADHTHSRDCPRPGLLHTVYLQN